MATRDYRSEPFERMVTLGESHVGGAGVLDKANRWVTQVAKLIERFQGRPLELYNKGIGANAISPRSPGYEASVKPSAMERYRDDVIALEPDLFILSYGLNDMRAGMPPEEFREDMATIIRDVKAACNPVMLLTTVYHMSRYDWYPPFDVGSVAATRVYNLVICQLAEEHDCLLADIWSAEGQADWVIHPDTVHANDLGHLLIAHRVFETLATHCSGIAAGLLADFAEIRKQVEATLEERTRPAD